MLHIWLPKQQGQLYIWQSKTNDWQGVDGWQKVSEIATSKQVCLYFSSVHLLSVNNSMPAAQLKQLGQAGLQYLFEDISLTPVEQLQIRQLNVANYHYLYALPQQDIEAWQNSASLVGLNVQLLLPDFLLLPSPQTGSHQAYLYHDDVNQITLLRQSQVKGVGVGALPLLPRFLTDENNQKTENINSLAVLTDSVSKNNHQTPSDITTTFNDDFLSLLADNNIRLEKSEERLKPISNNKHSLNFAIRKSSSRFSPVLKLTVIVAILAMLVQLAVDGFSQYRYAQSVEQIDGAINKQYQSWFPDERLNNKTNLQLQLASKLTAESLQNESVLKILDNITPLIKKSTVGVSSIVADTEQLELFLIADKRTNIDNLIKALNEQGMQPSLGTVSNVAQANQPGAKVAAKVTIKTNQ